jgi:hypothetical protein
MAIHIRRRELLGALGGAAAGLVRTDSGFSRKAIIL